MTQADYEAVGRICAAVYPTERPYTQAELEAHHQRFPEGQFVTVHEASGAVAGVHFTLIVHMSAFHIDDSWDTMTAGDSFADHDPVAGHTLYGADVFVSPAHQHHGLAHALTDATRQLVVGERLWRMVGGSRLPGYGAAAANVPAEQYVREVVAGQRVDPVLSAHLKDGWNVIKAIHGYLQHDPESAGWAAVIQWINPDCPPPAGDQLAPPPASRP
jgi:GNAT superfamily N-acetyltransferase